MNIYLIFCDFPRFWQIFFPFFSHPSQNSGLFCNHLVTFKENRGYGSNFLQVRFSAPSPCTLSHSHGALTHAKRQCVLRVQHGLCKLHRLRAFDFQDGHCIAERLGNCTGNGSSCFTKLRCFGILNAASIIELVEQRCKLNGIFRHS